MTPLEGERITLDGSVYSHILIKFKTPGYFVVGSKSEVVELTKSDEPARSELHIDIRLVLTADRSTD